jgi:hypothetical protein
MIGWRWGAGLLLAAGWACGFEVAGTVSFEDEPHVRAGVRVILLARGDTAYTDAQGAFRFEIPLGLARPRGSGAPRGLQARVRAGVLEYYAADRTDAMLEGFGADGRRWAAWRHRPEAPGWQKVDLAPRPGEGKGLGWLRIRSGGMTEQVRLVRMGPGFGALGAADRQGAAIPAAAKRASDPYETIQILDSLLVASEGYYPEKRLVAFSPGSGPLYFTLWKNSLFGMDPAEVEAWKAFLQRPSVTLAVSSSHISLPPDLIEGYVVTADGKRWTDWWADPCHPYSLPVRVVLAYARQGIEYRDTVELDDFKPLRESFRAVPDSTPASGMRFRMSWTWPEGLSVLPERDWMELALSSALSPQISISYPDVFQIGMRFGIEGGRTVYGQFDPRAGAGFVTGSAEGRVPGFRASFTRARRPDHDLRLVLDETRPAGPMPVDFALAGDWPAEGVLRLGQRIRLSAASLPPPTNARLYYRAGAMEQEIVPGAWDGSPVDWAFSFPLRDTLGIRIFAKNADWPCEGADSTPVLRIAPSPGDSAVAAFEPNDAREQAAPVAEGKWMEAATDYRPSREADRDFYRFRAAAGSGIRITLRKRDPGWGSVYDAADQTQFLYVGPGLEDARIFAVPESGELVFEIRTTTFTAGRYAFRVDRVP